MSAAFQVLTPFCNRIFETLDAISGHTLKHLAAGAAGFWILRMLEKRQPTEAP